MLVGRVAAGARSVERLVVRKADDVERQDAPVPGERGEAVRMNVRMLDELRVREAASMGPEDIRRSLPSEPLRVSMRGRAPHALSSRFLHVALLRLTRDPDVLRVERHLLVVAPHDLPHDTPVLAS